MDAHPQSTTAAVKQEEEEAYADPMTPVYEPGSPTYSPMSPNTYRDMRWAAKYNREADVIAWDEAANEWVGEADALVWDDRNGWWVDSTHGELATDNVTIILLLLLLLLIKIDILLIHNSWLLDHPYQTSWLIT